MSRHLLFDEGISAWLLYQVVSGRFVFVPLMTSLVPSLEIELVTVLLLLLLLLELENL